MPVANPLDQLVENLGDYLMTRRDPWANEEEVRLVVKETVRLLFTEGVYDTLRIVKELGYVVD